MTTTNKQKSGQPGHVQSQAKAPRVPHRTQRIGIVLSDGCDFLGVSVIAEAFSLASRLSHSDASSDAYNVVFLSEPGGMIRVPSSLQISTDALEMHGNCSFDALFVAAADPYGSSPRVDLTAHWLAGARGRTPEIIFLCANSTQSEPTRGPSPPEPGSPRLRAFDDAVCAVLTRIRRDGGDTLAQRVAQELAVVFRAVGNLALEASGTLPADRVRIAARWLQENCHRPVTVGDAAAAAAMSGHSFARHFEQELGVSPSNYLLDLRLRIACRLLLETDLAVDKIARLAAMRNGTHLARHFRMHMKILPTEYRAYHRDVACRRSGTGAAPALADPGGRHPETFRG
ncbi:helix-turn-helix domain-containing protein [Paraburkholderia caledonica]|uniref:helix-turn-helix domain-containing protein n=1 Tax=Paraburkholderia caledonica TaxID=134536 RepID=UPI000DF00A67|nr:helix-turn-helix domain-containing protein [Paraburkholderia caledonica]AXF18891.1 AraC family transcriptional regulator [Paraburkholderia caledonica]